MFIEEYFNEIDIVYKDGRSYRELKIGATSMMIYSPNSPAKKYNPINIRDIVV